jgi:hypothetical protein
VETNSILPLFSDEDGAFEIDVEVTFYEFLSVCAYFALQQLTQQQNAQQQQQQQKQQNQLAQLLQLQQQQQLLFQQLQNKSFVLPSSRESAIQTPEQTTPFLDLFVMRVGDY